MHDRLLRRLLLVTSLGVVVRPVGCTDTEETSGRLPLQGTSCKSGDDALPELKKTLQNRRSHVGNGKHCVVEDVLSVDKGPDLETYDNGREITSWCAYTVTVEVRDCEEHGGCIDGGGRPLRVDDLPRVAAVVRQAGWV